MPVSQALLGQLLAAAIRLSGLPAIDPATLPEVRMLGASALADKVCPEQPARCASIAAVLDTENNLIYMRDSLDPKDPSDNSFLVHELVHLLQFRRDGHERFATCSRVLSSEYEAYAVQNRYLAENGQLAREGGMLRFMRCPPER